MLRHPQIRTFSDPFFTLVRNLVQAQGKKSAMMASGKLATNTSV